MAYEVIRAADVALDLELIFDFLVAAAEGFDEDSETAFDLAQRRFDEIGACMEDLGHVPHPGLLRPHLGDGIRNVAKGRAVYYFEVDDDRQVIRVLAVFFGGQDHEAGILLRPLSQS